MPTTKPAALDLDNFDGLTDDNDAFAALLAECKRLRAENERLRSGLTECVQFLEDRQDPDDTDEDHLISFARAALEPQS